MTTPRFVERTFSFEGFIEANKGPMPDSLKRHRDRIFLAWEYWVRKSVGTLSPERRVEIRQQARNLR